MPTPNLVIRGAREHNLRAVDLELPSHQLIVFTGVSGSGKSSLAFDTLYAEGQRRYIESLSSGARAFLGQMERPDVDRIDGLSPAISIDQKATGHNPRSTVATVTEIYDYLRVLFARIGTPHCVRCGRPIGAQTTEEVLEQILALPDRSRIQILAPIAHGRRGEFQDVFDDARRAGFVRVRVDGEVLDLSEDIRLDRRRRHDIDLVVDRLVLKPDIRSRLADSVELALEHGEGNLIVNVVELGPDHQTTLPGPPPAGGRDLFFSRSYACTDCGISYAEPSPQMFSFNSPQGFCPTCEGLGTRMEMDPDLVVPDPTKSINEGAIAVWGEPRTLNVKHLLEGLARHFGFSLDTPWQELTDRQRQAILFGTDERIHFVYVSHQGRRYAYHDYYRGVLETFQHKFSQTTSEKVRAYLHQFIRERPCPACRGARLRPEALAVTVGGKSIAEVTALTIQEAALFFDQLQLDERRAFIAQDLLREIRGRLNFLLNVGLHYLTLHRSAPTLSGGEAQRIRLASQIGAGLVGVLYILDEPSIGLHHRDNQRLLATLGHLRDLGNTVIVVEHDEETMRAADFLVDFGPGPGRHGGEVVALGTVEDVAGTPESVTGQYLTGKRHIPIPATRRKPLTVATEQGPPLQGGEQEGWLTVFGARHNNLKNVDVRFPLGTLIGVTGVSGSGKSSLVNDILYAALARELNGAATTPGLHDRIEGLEHLDKVIVIDQSPIGRTPRSNPATYTKALDPIRMLFASLPEAKARGYAPGRFSFNVPGGRCEACEGNGYQRLEMDFLADVWVRCEVCQGARFHQETLQVKYKGRNISDVLNLTVAEALEHFEAIPAIRRVLQTLHDVGLDYIQLGQPAPTLSGGEAQRIKLSRELARASTGRTLYLLDEPTTGLHFADIQKLLEVLNRLVDAGNTVVVIEHNLEVIKTADYLIDLGPEGGEEGGFLVAAGTPEEVAEVPDSHTGRVLRQVLQSTGHRARGTGHVPPLPELVSGAPADQPTGAQSKEAPSLVPRAPSPGPPEGVRAIVVKGARQHNLKNVDAVIPREKMTLFTGVSGSGKSSLALDTIYAEGQRRYVESLSTYARQFINQLEKPHVDFISGLSPAISIEQKSTSANPRSTVGTVTEVYDYLRILFARLGTPHCVHCGGVVGGQTVDEMVDRILSLPPETRIYLLAPVVLGRAEDYEDAFERARREGFLRVRIDGEIRELSEAIQIDRRRRHEVEIVVDRLLVRPEARSRIADSVELALAQSGGTLIVHVVEVGGPPAGGGTPPPGPPPAGGRLPSGDLFFSQERACRDCGTSYEELSPQSFSFNSPLGWCPVCEGLGFKRGVDPDLVAPDRSKTIRQGAIQPWGSVLRHRPFLQMLEALAAHHGFDLDTPLNQWSPEHLDVLFYGSEEEVPWGGERETGNGKVQIANSAFRYEGLINTLTTLHEQGEFQREIAALMRDRPCPACRGRRVRAEAQAVRLRGKTIWEITDLTLGEAAAFFDALTLDAREQEIGGEALRAIRTRLKFLNEVGLGYLTLSRSAPTLSGGEAQRIRLASQIGAGLTGVLYVLDEPTIGLHQRDNERLLTALKNLRDLGNTVLVVEHDPGAIQSADYILDFGPGAGHRGGEIVAHGTLEEIRAQATSLTGQYLSGRKAIPVRTRRRPPQGLDLVVRQARHHNLKDLDVRFPLGLFICVTGVSGSGKSSLVHDILYRALAQELHGAHVRPGEHWRVEGIEHVDKVIHIDQSPIGTTPRSDPVTYVGAFDAIRTLYAQLPEAKRRGYTPRRFSFNAPGGRCEACWGYGYKKIEMHFLADVWVKCEVCDGARYNHETLQVQYHGKSIADVLDMTVAEALEHFANVPRVRHILQTLADVGLDYLRLGQSAPTLSGGEAQRVKLARELSRPSTGRTVYLLDEPTTGLHYADIHKLLEVLNRFVDAGNTVIVIEHNMEVIKTADWVIDLGPEGGEEGGRIVAEGTPEQVALVEASHTGRILRNFLGEGWEQRATRRQSEPVLLHGSKEALAHSPALVREVTVTYDAAVSPTGKPQTFRVPTDPEERWHKLHQAFAQERDAYWNGDDLQTFIDLARSVEGVGEPDWSNREYVALNVAGQPKWWCRIKTGQPIYFRAIMRTANHWFQLRELEEQLGLKPWLEQDPPIECRSPRIYLKNRQDHAEIWLDLCLREEFDTGAMRALLARVVEGFKSL